MSKHNRQYLEESLKQEPAKLTNKRANLRAAVEDNKGERCGFCQYFTKPDGCKIIDGPVTADVVCDWIQSRDVKAPEYDMKDADWLAFVQGMVEEQPYQHIVIDGALTPEGPLVLIEDTADPKHRFSLSREFHIGHTSFEHHWTQDEVDRLVQIGRKSRVSKSTPSVPTAGPENAAIAFVAASPCPIDGARSEPLVGPVGETFFDRYLKPLNLKRSEVVLTHLVPNVVKDEGGSREPTPKEIEEWDGWISKELDRTKPRIIIALGKAAQTALGDRADFMLPHPSVVRRFGTSGSLDRKIPLIRKAIKRSLVQKLSTEWVAKQERDDQEGGGDTRGEVALELWLKNWDEMLPSSGKGRFVVQHHWRGLKPDDIGKSDEQLLSIGGSLHADIRFESEDALWGFAVLGDKRKILAFSRGQRTKDEKNQGSVKLPHPKEWLTIASKKPHIAKPGEPGATSIAAAKFFEVDSGTYRLGVARQSFVEVFLDGENLSGRFVFQRADFDGRRVWLIDKPNDQTPTIDRDKTPDRLIRELRRKRQDTLIWAGPDQDPQKINVASGKIVKKFEIPILKAHQARQVVYITVLDPYLFGDAHGDWIPPAAVEETAWRWFEKSRVIGLNHSGKANAEPVESWIVQYPSNEDYLNAMHNRPHRALRLPFGRTHTHSGAWNLGIKLGDDLWRDYKAGKIKSVSVGGFGHKTPISRGTLPDVTFVDLVEST